MWGRRSTVSRRRWPELEQLEDRLTPAALRPIDTFSNATLIRTDDSSSAAVELGFTLNFFGINESSLFVNNNGNVTFDGPLSTFTPFGLSNPARQIIAPFFADVDTRDPSSNPNRNNVVYGSGTLDGRNAFQVTWDAVGYFSTRVNRLNTFQLLLIERADRAEGDFDIEFNYDRIEWETGQASGGNTIGQGGSSARVGYANSVNNPTFFELAGSGVPGSFLDGNPTRGLTTHSLNSDVLGRYVLEVRNGAINRPPEFDNLPEAITLQPGVDTFTFDVDASDLDEDVLTYALVEPVLAGVAIDADTGVIDLDQLAAGEYTQVVAVSDGINTIQATLTITVLNAPPAFDNLPAEITLRPGVDVFTFDVDASDPDEDALTFGLVEPNLNDVVIDAATGVVDLGQLPAGDYTQTVEVFDGVHRVRQTLTIHVVNASPTFGNLPDSLRTRSGVAGQFTVHATDPERQTLTFSPVAFPSWASMDEAGLISFTPPTSGTFTLTVRVEDALFGSAQSSLTLVVNDPPSFVGLPSQLHFDETRLLTTFPVTASDPENDVLTYSLVTTERGVSIDSTTGLLSFPLLNGPDDFSVRLRVEDSQGNSAEQDVRITVANLPPTFEVGANVVLLPGQFLDRVLTFSDPGPDNITFEVDYFGDASVILSGAGLTLGLDDEGAPPFAAEGTYNLLVRISDGTEVVVGTIRVSVFNASALIEEQAQLSIAPGTRGAPQLFNDDGMVQGRLEIEQPLGAANAAVATLIEYSSNPRPEFLPDEGEFLDLNVRLAEPGSTATLVFKPQTAGQRFAVYRLDETGQTPQRVFVGFFTPDENGFITVPLSVFLGAGQLGNTVFTVSLVKPVTQTGTVTGPTAQAGTGDQAALSQSATFISQTQLSLGVTTAQARQLAPAGTARGVTTAATSGLGSAFSASSGDDTEEGVDGTGIAFVGDEPGQRGRPRPWWALWHEDGDPLPIRETKVAPAVEDKVPATPTTDPLRGDEQQQDRKDEDKSPRDEPSALLPPAVDCYFGDALPALAAVVPAVALVRETHRRPRGKRRRLW